MEIFIGRSRGGRRGWCGGELWGERIKVGACRGCSGGCSGGVRAR
ncbi:MAG: hypothetical protein HOQ38_12725 [Nonomuraea sp.]|nr:hypothetical protein [Nonomuraea sp.]